MKQGLFHFYNSKTYHNSDYIITDYNHSVYDYVMSKNWISNCTIISGPRCCGKTHLAYIWAQKYKGLLFSNTSEKQTGNINILSVAKNQNIVIHNFLNFESNWEIALLKIYNSAVENSQKILITSNTKINDIEFKLMDLKSRIISSIELKLSHPDEIISEIILSKLLHEKQIYIEPKFIKYILKYPGISTAIFNKVIDELYDMINLKKTKVSTTLLSKLIKNSFN